jgi:hypothetical protein
MRFVLSYVASALLYGDAIDRQYPGDDWRLAIPVICPDRIAIRIQDRLGFREVWVLYFAVNQIIGIVVETHPI